MKKIKIGKKVENQLKNCYVLSHDYMISNDNTIFESIISKDNPFLNAFIEEISNFVSGIRGCNPDDISESWFDEFYENLDKTVENYSDYFDEIRFNPFSEGDLGWNSYNLFSISFFDETGNEFKVEVQ